MTSLSYIHNSYITVHNCYINPPPLIKAGDVMVLSVMQVLSVVEEGVIPVLCRSQIQKGVMKKKVLCRCYAGVMQT